MKTDLHSDFRLSQDDSSYWQESAEDSVGIVLSKLAALNGHAVPAFRFSLVQFSLDGIELSKLSFRERIIEMWKSRFPTGEIKEIEIPDRSDFPLIWVSKDSNQLLIIRGVQSGSSYICEAVDGQTIEKSYSEIESGNFLALRVDNNNKLKISQDSPQTARDWFIYAISKQRRVFFEAVFATFILSVIGLLISMYTMQVYDRVLPTKGYSTLWVLTLGVMIAIFFDFAIRQARHYLMDRASANIDLELSSVFFAKAMNIRMDARPSTVGTFASQIRYFESVRNFMTSTTLFVLADLPFAGVFVIVIYLLAGPVAVIPLLMVFTGVLVGLISQKALEKATSDNMKDSNRKNGLLIEAIDGIESIKAVGGEWKMLDIYRHLTSSIAKSERVMSDITVTTSNMVQVIQQVNYVGLIAFGAYTVTSGELSQGGLFACTIISGRAFGPFLSIPKVLLQWKQAKIALESLDKIMSMPDDRSSNQRLIVPSSCSGELRLEDVLFFYRDDKPAIVQTSLTFPPGDRVAVIGSIGSGKSTLIKMMSGLYRPTSGSIYLDGVNIENLAPEFVREQIGYLPQDVRLFSGTLRENIVMGLPTPNDSVILRAAKLTGLDKVIQNHPKGLELEITEGGRGLSGGQRQLVGLTRLLIARPKIVLMDEPTASMDNKSEEDVMKKLFSNVPLDSTLVVVTHKLNILPLVKRVIIMDKGKIIADGPKDQIFPKNALVNK